MIFYKTSTSGNDFIIVDRGEFERSTAEDSEFSKDICRREKSDGVIFYSVENEITDFSIINSDGSKAEVSGNGMAGLASVLFASGQYDKKVVLKTRAGIRTIHLIKSENTIFKLQVDMGLPEFNEKKFFPFLIRGEKKYEYKGTSFYPVSTGNPHAVVILNENTKDLSKLIKTGKKLESGTIFPERTNVEFVFPFEEKDNNEPLVIEAFFYERGAGVTSFSSTGTTAVFSVLNALGKIGESMKIQTREGTVPVFLKGKIFIESSTKIVYKREYHKD